MHGPEGLTWGALDAWARFADTSPDPLEVEALFAIDHAVRHPEEPRAASEPKAVRAWPTRKGADHR